METSVTDERMRFVRDRESGQWSMTELCERYGVSRPTGYKWMARREGRAGFADRSHAPHQCPHRTSADLEALIVAARRGPAGAPRSFGRCSALDTRPSPGRRGVPLMRSWIATRCSTRIGDDGSGRILVRPRSHRAPEPSVARGFQRAVQDR